MRGLLVTLTRAVLVEGWKEQTGGKDTVTVWRTLSRLFFFFFFLERGVESEAAAEGDTGSGDDYFK